MKFTKMHGAGNDYVVIDARGLDADWHSLARDMCHRRLGVGSDGLLLVLPSNCADVRMRMFNPDGSEAEMCGNGIRWPGEVRPGAGNREPRQEDFGGGDSGGSTQAGAVLERSQGNKRSSGYGRAGAAS